MILPPKRFQSTQDVKYDGIRHKWWFCKLSERRTKNDLLSAAVKEMVSNGLSQADAAKAYGVDPREVRDFYRFYTSDSPSYPSEKVHKTIQFVINIAYDEYMKDGAWQPFTHYINKTAKTFGMNPRHAKEAWEIDPNLYPAGYK